MHLISVQTISSGRWSLIVFVASITVALLFQSVLPVGFSTDGATDFAFYYDPIARNLLSGDGLVHNDEPATANPPGYSLLLAGVYGLAHETRMPDRLLLRWLGLLCFGASSTLLFLAANLLWRPWPALLAPLVWLTYPLALWLTTYPNTELPFITVLYAGYYLGWRAVLVERRTIWGWLAGLCIGAAMLLRAIAIGVGLLLAVTVWFGGVSRVNYRQRASISAAILIASFLVIWPWQVWLSAHTSRTALLGTNGVPSIRDGLTFAVNDKGYRSQSSMPPDVANLMQELNQRTLDGELTSMGQIISNLVDQTRQRPLAVFKLLLIKAARSWYGADSGRWESITLAIQSVYLALIALASLRAWRQGSISRRWLTGAWIFALYFWGMTITVLSIVRYMVPAMGLLFLILPSFVIRQQIGHLGPQEILDDSSRETDAGNGQELSNE